MNGLGGEEALILGMDYTEESLLGAGALKGQDGKDGVSPVISVNTSTADTYKLDITDKNGTITTPNLVGKQGLQGIQGEQGKPADNPIVTENAENTEDVYKLDLTVGETVFTTKNIIGKQGLEGVSPTVTTSPDNTTEDYRLNITTKGGSFTTPNLRGPKGEQGPIGESAVSAINPRGDYDVNAEPSYTKSDYITYTDGNTYVCKLDNPTNEPPIDGTVTDTYWQVIAFRGAQGIAGKDGEKGADGVTFTPSIDENGVLSFTNNGGLENPEPINIKGDNGITFTPSIDTDGYLSFTNDGNLDNPEPIKVLGKDGEDGKDGTTYIPSIGTVTTVESNAEASAGVTIDEETKEAVFNFAIPKGNKGLDGKDGVQISDNETVENKTWSSSKIAEEVTGAIDTINTSLANYSIPLNLYMGIKHYLAIKINTHNMNYSFNMSDRSGNIYEGTFFSYNGSFSIQITKVNNSSTKNGYILGFRQYKVSDSEIYLVAKVSDYNYINGVINTPSILKSNIEILVNDDSTLWDKGTDIVVKELATMDKVSRVYDWTFRKQTYATMEDFLIDMVNRGIIINGASNSVVISISYSYIAAPEITELNDKGFVNNSMAGGCLYIDGVYSTDTSNQGNRLVVRFEGQDGSFVYLDNSGWGTERRTYRQYVTK